ncbi:MAG: tetratricopeptide repeat protein [Bryobacterales bacterium]|nr:tetratricopeptide repeat protein [Bryobacterales bacterium]
MPLLCAAVLLLTLPATAQFLPQLQARTPAEFDAYLDVLEAAPAQQEALARSFLRQYADSDLRLPVLEVIAKASRNRGDAAAARQAAIDGLQLAPEYIPLLTLLAAVDANTTARPDGRAATEALRLLDQARAPRSMDAETWRHALALLRAENLVTLAIVAFKSGQLHEAVRRLEESLRWEPAPAAQYRLALLYLERKRTAEARTLLEKVAASADPALAARARDVLTRTQ